MAGSIIWGVGLAGVAALWGGWRFVDRRRRRVMGRLAAEIRAIAHGGTGDGLDAARFAGLAPLPDAVSELCQRFAEVRGDLSDRIKGATQRAEDNAAQLAAVVNSLSEGVIVCNLDHQMVLYNQVAKDMLAAGGQIGLQRSVFDVMAPPPILHKLAVIKDHAQTAGPGAPFLAGSADGRKLLQARMTLFRDAQAQVLGYVLSMVDAGPEIAALAKLDAMLKDMRDEMEDRLNRFEKTDAEGLVRETNIARATMRRLTTGCQRALSAWCPVTDVRSSDLFEAVRDQFTDAAHKVTLTGLPVWLRAEPQSLASAIAVLVRKVAAYTKVAEIDLAAGFMATSYSEEFAPSSSDEIAWADIVWTGEPVPVEVLDQWQKASLPAMGGMRVRDVLAYHGYATLSQRSEAGRSWLRVPMRKGRDRDELTREPLPARPEFYDMSLLSIAQGAEKLSQRPLTALTYVVFDTETTGLDPSGGDEIVQIGGVRVVNGRILSGENFESLVHPGRPIPEASIKYHGITDTMVKNADGAEIILPRFKSFAANSVLVAHNAAFDLKFLRKREALYKVRFDNPVLDTMLLSAYLDGPDVDHSLDAICERYGIAVSGRHTALGDALVTAAVLLRQIDALGARNITTYGQTVSTLGLALTLQHSQQAL